MMEMPTDTESLTILGFMLAVGLWVIFREWRLQKQEDKAAEQSERRERKAKGEE